MKFKCAYAILVVLFCLTGCEQNAPFLALVSDGLASSSSSIALSPDGRSAWVVNPDDDSVTQVHLSNLKAGVPISVGREPWRVALTPSEQVVVMNRLDGTLSILEQSQLVATVEVGPELGGLALSPSGSLAYVTASSSNEVAVVNLTSRTVIDRLQVGQMPWAIAVTDDGDAEDQDEQVIVTHRLARLNSSGKEATNDGKEGWLTVIDLDGGASEVVLPHYEFGYPNVLEGLTIFKSQVFVSHLLNRPELPRNFENTVSGALSTLSLINSSRVVEHQLHINDTDFSTPVNFPRAVAISPDGKTAYLVLAGTNAVMGVDLSFFEKPSLVGFWPVGNNPRGIVLNTEGTRAYVMNYLSRDISVLDLSNTTHRPELVRIRVAPENLSEEMLVGKRLFNNASDPRLSRLGWISCASCHPDGGSDGTTWITPEGHRQTMPLWNLEGTAPFHISASRDELQDFEDDIETLMNGVGLAPEQANRLLGQPNGSTSDDLDALAKFVLTGIRVPRAALAKPEMIAEGRHVFEQAGCADCHGGSNWTLSHLPKEVGLLAPFGELEVEVVLQDVGTYHPKIDVLGKNGFDIPTLLGVHATAPYLHDGSASTLEGVLNNPSHTLVILTQDKRSALVDFLMSIDDLSTSFE